MKNNYCRNALTDAKTPLFFSLRTTITIEKNFTATTTCGSSMKSAHNDDMNGLDTPTVSGSDAVVDSTSRR